MVGGNAGRGGQTCLANSLAILQFRVVALWSLMLLLLQLLLLAVDVEVPTVSEADAFVE